MAERWVGVLGVVAFGGLAAAGLYWFVRHSKYSGTRDLLRTGRPELDRYDAQLAAAIDKAGPMAIRRARLVKGLAYHESAGYRAAESTHSDGVSVGLMGLNRRYFSGDLTNPWLNAELGTAHLTKLLEGAGGDVRLALSRYNAGPRSGVTGYADRVLATTASLYQAPTMGAGVVNLVDERRAAPGVG